MSSGTEGGVSIYEHIRAHLPLDGPGLTEGGDRLPDEPEEEDELPQIVLAPGLRDRILESGSVVDSEQAAARSFRLFKAVVRKPFSNRRYEELHEDLRTNELTGFLDPLVGRVYHSGLSRDAVRELALRLVSSSPHRMPVKVGICVLGLCARHEDREILLTLGRHEEFSHYVGVTMTNALPYPEESLWQLAKVVQGWGRVAFIEQLASTQRPEIKAWLLRDGFASSFLWTELASIAATTGELARELRADGIDDELYLSAGRIIRELIRSRMSETTEDVEDYEDAPEAIRLFLQHVARRKEHLESFEPVAAIVDYLEMRRSSFDRFEEHWSEEGRARAAQRLRSRWVDEERTRVATHARWILHRPAWRRAIDEGLRSADHWTFALAEEAARWLGDDTVPLMVARLREHPDDDHTWFEVARLADGGQFDELLEMARDRVARHEPDAEEWGPRWTIGIHQEVERFPGMGWPLFRAELESPILRDRHYGLSGLARLADASWPDEADAIVETISRSDPDEEIRTRARDLLSKRTKEGTDAHR
ncbi:MAG: hypothetical protein ACRDHM_07325 [Actinomycetota bacterium]